MDDYHIAIVRFTYGFTVVLLPFPIQARTNVVIHNGTDVNVLLRFKHIGNDKSPFEGVANGEDIPIAPGSSLTYTVAEGRSGVYRPKVREEGTKPTEDEDAYTITFYSAAIEPFMIVE